MKKIPKSLARERIMRTYTLKFWYWLGGIGQKGTNAVWNTKSKQKLVAWWYAKWEQRAKQPGLDAPGIIDCCGENKYFRWLQPNGTVIHNFDKQGDLNQEMIRDLSKKLGLKGGPISTLPKGRDMLIVWYDGHMGYSLGDGTVLEARGGAFGVQINDIKERGFTEWFEDPFIDYEEDTPMLFKGCPDGEPVREWQESLLAMGYKMINDKGVATTADSNFGSGTTRGTNLFKKDVGLPQDGKVDDITYAKMLNKMQNIISTKIAEITDLKFASSTITSTLASKTKIIEDLQVKIKNHMKTIDNNISEIEELKIKFIQAEINEIEALKKNKLDSEKIYTLEENIEALNNKIKVLSEKVSENSSINNATVGQLIKAIFSKLKPKIDDVLNTK